MSASDNMSEDANSTILRLQATIENLQKDLRAMRVGREHDDLQWRKLWEKEKKRADEAIAILNETKGKDPKEHGWDGDCG